MHLRQPPAAAAAPQVRLLVALGDSSSSAPVLGPRSPEARSSHTVGWGPAARGPDSVLFQLAFCNCSDSARTCQCVVDLRLISFEMEF